ncbi:hypothetical protein CEP52_002579 [Fusarium oligoseptatum]|uniref:NADH:flavin oxidoreductase/NADH oxidase N-terminal domain-containing protein n=1 Tax=Fusarium oligoseptatum TaxID=2604345 RepID=A0A428UCS1_9HYPO|nr:hypothetical protein CEP52_002579 [Fusarium oligoseptatum]
MSAKALFQPLPLKRGPPLKHRLLLAPLTNWQCNDDGTIPDEEVEWLTRCAIGGFSMVMTCAANVHPFGKVFPGQMGIYSDKHLAGLRRVADAIRKHGAISSVQLHHAGGRASTDMAGTVVGPSEIPSLGVLGLSLQEVEQLREDFIIAALRAETAGFDGVEVHSAFGWIFMQFLSPAFNRRTDHYGGSLENRSRFLFEVIDGIRTRCRPDFQIGLRISMERYGMELGEVRDVCARALREEQIDYLDLAVWDYTKRSQEKGFEGRTLLSVFTELPRSNVRLGASGKIMNAQQALEVLDGGCDFVMLGKAAILQSSFPKHVKDDVDYQLPKLPVTEAYLKRQGLSPKFVQYMRTWEGFVAS